MDVRHVDEALRRLMNCPLFDAAAVTTVMAARVRYFFGVPVAVDWRDQGAFSPPKNGSGQ